MGGGLFIIAYALCLLEWICLRKTSFTDKEKEMGVRATSARCCKEGELIRVVEIQEVETF